MAFDMSIHAEKSTEEHHHMISKLVSFALGAGLMGASAAVPHPSSLAAQQDIQELLAAARGVSATFCTLAADGVFSWGGRWLAPAEAVRSDIRSRMQFNRRNRRLSADESRALLTGIASTDPCERHMSATLIGRFGDSTIAGTLGSRLSAGPPTERQAALIALGLLDASSQLQEIIRALRDETPGVRANAAWALGRINEKTAAPALLAAVSDRDETVRAAAIVALGHIGGVQDSIEVLIRVLRTDTSPEVRRVAAWALGELRNRTATPALVQALSADRSEEVREMSVWALATINARDALDAIVTAMRKDESAAVRETSAWAVAELNGRRVIDALADVVGNDREPDVRGTAAWAIGQLHPGKAPASLVKAIRDADPDVRLKAAWALSEIEDPEVAGAIVEALKTETKDRVQQAEVRALVRSGEASEDIFRRLLESKDADTRGMAIRALAGHRSSGPWPWPWPRPRPMP
jgi:HEAT repeat protein